MEISIPKKGIAKECSNYHTTALLSHAGKVMFKILEDRLQSMWSETFQIDVQAGFRKARGMRDQIAKICWIMNKAREFQKNIYFCFIDYVKAFDCVIAANCEISLKRWEHQTPYLSPEKPVCELRSNISNWSWNNWLVQNWERNMTRLYIVTLLI